MQTMDIQTPDTEQLHVGVRELRGNLTHYLREASRGLTVLVTSHDTVIAEIRAPAPARRPQRQPGALRGQIRMAEDVDTMPSDLLDSMEA